MKTILVVEDFSSTRQFLCHTLQSKGYKTVAAATSEEAYEVLTNERSNVNLILSDFNMPDCSGFDLLRTIKRNPSLEKIPVVFLTSETLSDKIRIAQETGMAGFIHKPYREEAFFAEINRAIAIAGSIVNIVD
jgi:CheY-like chemotaxis protein